jgi:hypothetical protein
MKYCCVRLSCRNIFIRCKRIHLSVPDTKEGAGTMLCRLIASPVGWQWGVRPKFKAPSPWFSRENDTQPWPVKPAERPRSSPMAVCKHKKINCHGWLRVVFQPRLQKHPFLYRKAPRRSPERRRAVASALKRERPVTNKILSPNHRHKKPPLHPGRELPDTPPIDQGLDWLTR